jgi:hypothetical protein
MSSRTWHNGNPPHIGWWNASVNRNAGIWRWWDGTGWSLPVQDHRTAEDVTFLAKHIQVASSRIEWSDYYPENARVPRVAP